MKDIFIIGSKGIPAKYGGFETFVDELVSRKKKNIVRYHVACMAKNKDIYEYNDAMCFNINVPNIGPAKAIYYDITALRHCINFIKNSKLENCVVYILAARIGPFFKLYVKELHDMNCKVYINPDGHEWKREKWNWFIKKYWKLSEKLMVKYSDLVICDSLNIEKYICKEYVEFKPKTIYIAYGAEVKDINNETSIEKYKTWENMHSVVKNEYYLIVGRFVPENNFLSMIQGFMSSQSKKKLVIITNVEKNKYYKRLLDETGFHFDSRIKFIGTVYDKELLHLVRANAFAYFHGHSVGGTNPSLLEALATTKLNLLYDVGFNREVGRAEAKYWKNEEELSNLIDYIEENFSNIILEPKRIISEYFSWDAIIDSYEELWLVDVNEC